MIIIVPIANDDNARSRSIIDESLISSDLVLWPLDISTIVIKERKREHGEFGQAVGVPDADARPDEEHEVREFEEILAGQDGRNACTISC